MAVNNTYSEIEIEAEFHSPTIQQQSTERRATEPNPETTKQMPEIVDLHFQSLTLQSPEDEHRTSGGGNRQIGVEVDAAVKERGKAAALLDPETKTIFGGGLQSIESVEEASVEDDASETMEKTHSALPAANSARNPRSTCGGLLRRSSFGTKLPELMAVVFPWNRERESRTHGRAAVSDAPVLTREGGVTTRKFAAKPSVEEKLTNQPSSKEKGNIFQMSVVGGIIIFFQPMRKPSRGSMRMLAPMFLSGA